MPPGRDSQLLPTGSDLKAAAHTPSPPGLPMLSRAGPGCRGEYGPSPGPIGNSLHFSTSSSPDVFLLLQSEIYESQVLHFVKFYNVR